jgi:hypothetical protein
MALELKISESSYDNENHIATFNDDTGVYNAVTNLGGYGTPNPERNTLALVVSAIRVYNSDEYISYSDPITDATFNFTFSADGVYKVTLCALPFEAGAYDVSLMAEGYVFYSVLDNAVYKVFVRSNGEKYINETTDVYANSTYTSDILYYKVQSRTEIRRIEMFCSEIDSCAETTTSVYSDLLQSLDNASCLFNEAYYSESDDIFVYLLKIDKA